MELKLNADEKALLQTSIDHVTEIIKEAKALLKM